MTIALVGKYVAVHDAYLSVAEALRHAGLEHGTSVKLAWVDAAVNPETAAELERADGILVPGGFGGRGIEGKNHGGGGRARARHSYLGICLGMQIAVIESPEAWLGSMAPTPVSSTPAHRSGD